MNGSDIRTKDDGRDYRVPLTAALAAYRTWLAEHEAAWLAGAAPSRSVTGPWTSSRNAPNGCWKTWGVPVPLEAG